MYKHDNEFKNKKNDHLCLELSKESLGLHSKIIRGLVCIVYIYFGMNTALLWARNSQD